MGNGQGKDSSPHDGMKQTYCREQPRIIQKNSQQSKYSCRYRSNRQLHARRNLAQAAPHQAAHKHATPIERSHQRRRSIIHLNGIQIDVGSDADFHSYIKEDSHHAQCQMTEGPYTFFQLFSLLYPGSLDIGQRQFHQQQYNQRNNSHQCQERNHQLVNLNVLHRQTAEHDTGHEIRSKRSSHRIGGTTYSQTLNGLGTLDMASRQIRIYNHLQNGGRSPYHERTQ